MGTKHYLLIWENELNVWTICNPRERIVKSMERIAIRENELYMYTSMEREPVERIADP